MADEQPKSTSSLKLLDLPIDILLLLLPYLDAPSFLSLTSTCKALRSTDIVNDGPFWSSLVRRDFRVPNQPVVQNDGARWQKLYKRLRTQSRAFTWGNNEKGCLGHSFDTPMVRGRDHARARRSRHVNYPSEMEGLTKDKGIISDLQCGGWSTTMLTSRGALYTVGVLDGLQFDHRRPPCMQRIMVKPAALKYPAGLPQAGERYEPATAIKQFSSGRAHILALSDSGRIWSWHDAEVPGLHVKLLHHDTNENGRNSGKGLVKQVMAGWNKSAALFESSGIVIWEPLKLSPEECDASDAALVMESAVVPQTDYVESKHARVVSQSSGANTVGEVRNFVVLETCIIFSTSLGKVFAAQIIWDDQQQTVTEPVELDIPAYGDAQADAKTVTDVQGSFQSFAVFTKSGAVLTANQERLLPLLGNNPLSSPEPTRLFKRIPALQNKQVISLAFGDYHFHALHAPGYITSYGYEPQACGALGLGGSGTPENRLRGIRNQGIGGDGHLVPHAYTEGRRVWFEEEKRQWVRFITSGGVDQSEAAERIRMAIGSPAVAAQGEVSEWIEQEGRDWESKFGINKDDNLGAYFALSVTAAGWHSGALVLVNEDAADALKRAVEVPDVPAAAIDINDVPVTEDGPSSPMPPKPNPEREPESASPTSTSSTLADRVLDWGRYLLGLAPYNVNDVNYDAGLAYGSQNNTNTNTANRGSQHHHTLVPVDYGASPRQGFKYVWANDHFPRLRLSDGTEMPGEVAFDEWRYGRPQWKLDWEHEDIS